MSKMSEQKQKKQQSLLSRLKRAVQKVRFLLRSTIISRTWHAASLIRRASSLGKRHLSFNDPPGLKICSSDNETDSEASASRGPGPGLQRTISYPSTDEDDIDRRAEMFIANFRKQLRMERQISLQLRYHREHSFELISP
ncbi:hypothetical protein HN51_002167 [Arachis hypogaea]|uniref:DUF761 domain-containing protein n=3 Tax=Arachis TaxID=3817 RepID=A0A445ENR7_ARAHY|nr:uncharacterized protein LOC107461212 [Arachis duranensis]XP_025607370.1 uncharacterized protein LOC112698260 [Arachis hypogaea]QHO50334.1 uncharacterized protein DS421_1g21690 [Arachis hypogaea]RYR77021.1 hypothetical protein Ahy_A01g001508 [Arachis hypogaea]